MSRPRIHHGEKERRVASNLSSKLSMQRKRAKDKAAGTKSPQAPITTDEGRQRHNLASRRWDRKKRYGVAFNDHDFSKVRQIKRGIQSGQIPVRVGAAMIYDIGSRYGTKVDYKRLRGHFYGKWQLPKNVSFHGVTAKHILKRND